MDVLLGTLENLYDTEIDYYFRINFTGFTEIIDALGGIDVSSDYDFTAGGHDYHVGINHLDGEEALAFARERYSFTEGDRQRGKNQMAVIEGVLEKALSPSILTGTKVFPGNGPWDGAFRPGKAGGICVETVKNINRVKIPGVFVALLTGIV